MFVKDMATDEGRLYNLNHVVHFGPGIELDETIGFLGDGKYVTLKIALEDMPTYLEKLGLYKEVVL